MKKTHILVCISVILVVIYLIGFYIVAINTIINITQLTIIFLIGLYIAHIPLFMILKEGSTDSHNNKSNNDEITDIKKEGGGNKKEKLEMEKLEDLEKLQKLKESGAITQEEFDKEKQRILNENITSNNYNNEEFKKANDNANIKTSKKILYIAMIVIGVIILIAIIVSSMQEKDNGRKNEEKQTTTTSTTKSSQISKNETLYLNSYDSYDSERQLVVRIAYDICSAYNAYDVPQEVKIYDADGQGRYLLNIKKVNTTTGQWENVNRAIGYVESEGKYYTNYSANAELGKGNYSDFDKVKGYLKWGEPLLSGNDF